MDKILKTTLSGIGGTTVMTAASALSSVMLNQNFREPEHLATMIGRLAPFMSKRAQAVAGWAAHYGMGFVFAAVYVELWETRKIKHTIKNGLILGALSGVLGMLIWKATFKTHPLPPFIKKNNFYIQRIPAHIVFAVFATITYRLIKAQEEEKQLQPETRLTAHVK